MNSAKFFILSLLLPTLSFCQSWQKWVVTKVVNTHLELGVKEPSTYIGDLEKLYKGKAVYISDKWLFFSRALKAYGSYVDTVYIKECKTFQRAKDTEISLRYPGDELNCNPQNEKCFVGESFMRMLGSKKHELTFYELKGGIPDFYSYKLAVIHKNKKMGLLLENASILLILVKAT